MVQEEMKQKPSLLAFKREVKQWIAATICVGHVKTTHLI